MEEIDYEAFYNQVGKVIGWDFSTLECTIEKNQWDFQDEVKRRSNQMDILLDIGTGGGEIALKLAASVLLLIGIELSDGMLQTAHANLKASPRRNVRFLKMAAEHLEFPADFFDIITCRHAPFDSSLVHKVLRPGGIYLTQQVSEADKLNLKTAFGRGQAFHEKDGDLKGRYLNELKSAGISDIQVMDDNVTEYYYRPEDLLFLLKHTPIIPDFGKKKEDLQIFKQFIEQNRTDKGIATNAKRFLIIATKKDRQ